MSTNDAMRVHAEGAQHTETKLSHFHCPHNSFWRENTKHFIACTELNTTLKTTIQTNKQTNNDWIMFGAADNMEAQMTR